MAGLATESAKIGSRDLVSELKSYLKKTGDTYLGVVHRLDQPVEGLLVFGKNKTAADKLTKQVQFNEQSEKSMLKKYKALVYGHMAESSGVLTDYLIKNAKENTSEIVDVTMAKSLNAKKAILQYKVLEHNEDCDTVDILLKTGRHHQIRVQFAGAGCPLVGDLKYGTEESKEYSEKNEYKNVQLKAYKIEFNHPDSGKRLCFEV